MSLRSDAFARTWVSENVVQAPVIQERRTEAVRMAKVLIADAAAVGISETELNEAVGDAEDYLEDAYLEVSAVDEGASR